MAGAQVFLSSRSSTVLYPTHPGYPDHRDPRLVLPSRTFVFGDYERRVLESLAYEPGEVIVRSPRLDLDATVGRTTDDDALAAQRPPAPTAKRKTSGPRRARCGRWRPDVWCRP
jgi:hypothetical protein